MEERGNAKKAFKQALNLLGQKTSHKFSAELKNRIDQCE
jgi:hypothetical protein